MMTPDDFLRSITPGIKQPEKLGLDHFVSLNMSDRKYNRNVTLDLGLDKESIFNQLGANGLISFSDYIFLLTVLSTSRRHFEIAFKMFDLNGDGNVDAKEFEVVTNLMRNQSSMGARHRDHQVQPTISRKKLIYKQSFILEHRIQVQGNQLGPDLLLLRGGPQRHPDSGEVLGIPEAVAERDLEARVQPEVHRQPRHTR